MESYQVSDGPGPFERWVRIPVRGHQPDSGLGRGVIYGLINAGAIKSASLRKPGCRTGVRLVWLPSLLAYIERHAVGPVQKPSAGQCEGAQLVNSEKQSEDKL